MAERREVDENCSLFKGDNRYNGGLDQHTSRIDESSGGENSSKTIISSSAKVTFRENVSARIKFLFADETNHIHFVRFLRY